MTARSGLFVAPVPGTPPVGMAPTDGRLALAGLLGVTPRLVSGGAVTQSNSNMQFTLAQSVFQLPDTSNAAATFLSPVDSTVLTPAAGPSSGSRVDSIIAKQNNVENADADSRANAIILPGTAGAPGLPATLPAGYFRYANINVPTNATLASACTVTILSPAVLSPLPINAATYALLSTVTGAAGQQATVTADAVTANNGTYVWSGSSWRILSPVTIRFKGSILASTAITHDANVNYSTIVEDTAAGWNAAGGYYVVPAAGTYMTVAQIKADGSGAGGDSIFIRKNSTNVAASPNSPSGGFVGMTLTHIETCAVGDQLAVWCHGVNFTTVSDTPAHNNFLEIVRIA